MLLKLEHPPVDVFAYQVEGLLLDGAFPKMLVFSCFAVVCFDYPPLPSDSEHLVETEPKLVWGYMFENVGTDNHVEGTVVEGYLLRRAVFYPFCSAAFFDSFFAYLDSRKNFWIIVFLEPV